jgi:hypothetical protein
VLLWYGDFGERSRRGCWPTMSENSAAKKILKK